MNLTMCAVRIDFKDRPVFTDLLLQACKSLLIVTHALYVLANLT